MTLLEYTESLSNLQNQKQCAQFVVQMLQNEKDLM